MVPWNLIIGGAVADAGSIMSAIGAAKTESEKRKQAQRALEMYDDKTLQSQGTLLNLLYGNKAIEKARQLLPTANIDELYGIDARPGRSLTAKEQKQRDELYARYTKKFGSQMDVEKALTDARHYDGDFDKLRALVGIERGTPRSAGAFSRDQVESGGPGLLDQFETLYKQYDTEGQGQLSAYDSDTNRIAGLYDAMQSEARGSGNARKAEAERDAARMLRQMNLQTKASAMAGGLGDGTTLNSLYGANAGGIFEQLQRAKTGINEGVLNLTQAARAGQAGALDSRLTNRTNLGMTLMDRSQQLRSAPLQSQLGIFTSPMFNPYLGQDMTTYYPGVSPTGAALQKKGNDMVAWGSYVAGSGMGGQGGGGGGGGGFGGFGGGGGGG